MQRDQNDWGLSGVVADEPRLRTLKNGQSALTFTFLSIEHFTLGNGTPGRHENFFTVEVLGKQAEIYKRELQVGERYQIKGYGRIDHTPTGDVCKIRVFKIMSDVVNGC